MKNQRASVTVEVYSDVICPWCYISKTRLEDAIKMIGDTVDIKVEWKPYQLNATMPASGMERDEYLITKLGTTNVSAMENTVNKAGAEHGLRINFNQIKQIPNTFNAHRLLLWAKQHQLQQVLLNILFRKFFMNGQDLGSTNVLVAAATEAGLPMDEAIKFLASSESATTVQDAEETGVEMGVSMVPTFVIDGEIVASGVQAANDLAALIGKVAESRSRSLKSRATSYTSSWDSFECD